MNTNCPAFLTFLILGMACSFQAGSQELPALADTDTSIRKTISPWRLQTETSGQQVRLTWQPGDALRADHFIVETGADGSSFLAVAVLKGGQPGPYTHHQDLGRGLHYFRVRMVLLEGGEGFSDTVQVLIGSRRTVLLYPNPSTGAVTVTHPPGSGQEELQVVNLNGQVMKRVTVAGSSVQTAMDLAALPKGVYQVIWLSGPEKVVQKFILQ